MLGWNKTCISFFEDVDAALIGLDIQFRAVISQYNYPVITFLPYILYCIGHALTKSLTTLLIIRALNDWKAKRC